ncbi:class II glutamine amidotransferase [Neptuniibacter sp. 2_MG-2023]|uniref:class II glutamine amidotransferase n=1 Tax=Neptuniibacter sp. 2_MG-2023 TaxID=3062671 RepID=UPI0026E1457E|nr:class II glutamine amidotransferase [Neptuniibacter sp. 2_MG-2023]MDO6513710.1 class II glutamine amidotransferase [Neptuniibacter sp. 2_MG-2023]
MSSSPLLLTVLSSSPINVQLHGSVGFEGLGVGSISDMNPSRLVALGRDDVQRLEQLFKLGGGLEHTYSDLWAAVLYPNAPIETVDIQPFIRPQRGSAHLFSMVGDLPGIVNNDRFPIGDQWPISCTDQERAFCLLQERIRKLWKEGRPDHEMRLALVADYAGRLEKLAPHNFMYWDGEMMFSYTSLSSDIEPLAYQQFSGDSVKLNGALPLTIMTENDADIAIIASHSLLPQSTPMTAGSVLCFSSGNYLERCDPVVFWND